MNLEELRKYKAQILDVARANGISNVRVFGSVARGEAQEDSDLDLLVSAEPGIGLKFFTFETELEALLHRKVDVVSDKYINPHIQPYIMRDAQPL